MLVKDLIHTLSTTLEADEEICVGWQPRPDGVDKYTWAWICDNLQPDDLDNFLIETIYQLTKECPFTPVVASGDVVFVVKETK